jgi:hypothetical protein
MNENLVVYGWDAEKIDSEQLSADVVWQRDLKQIAGHCDAMLIANNHPYFSSTEFITLLSEIKENILILDPWANLKRAVNLSHEILDLGSVQL